jgi:hypothetical protein
MAEKEEQKAQKALTTRYKLDVDRIGAQPGRRNARARQSGWRTVATCAVEAAAGAKWVMMIFRRGGDGAKRRGFEIP